MTTASQTIATGRNTYRPGCAAQSRNEDLIYVDGITRGLRWNGKTATADELGITPPAAAPTIAIAGSGSTVHYAGYRFVDRDRLTPSNLTNLRSIATTAASGITYTWSALSQKTQARIELLEAYRSIANISTAVWPIYLAGFACTPHATAATSIQSSDGFCLFTTSGADHGFEVGDYILVAGFTPAEYNGVHRITRIPSSTTFLTDVGFTAAPSMVGTATQRVFQFGVSGTWSSETNGVGANPHVFTYSGAQRLAVGMMVTIAGHTVGAMNIEHRITAVTKSTFTTANTTDVADDVDGGTWTLTGITEAIADTDLEANSEDREMPILNPDGSFNARRFTPPRTTDCVVAMFGDRAWYTGDVYYRAGTVVTNGTTTLAGTNTAWPADLVDRWVYIQGETKVYTVSKVTGVGTIVLDSACATTASGKNYCIAPNPNERNLLRYSEQDEPESVPFGNTVIVQENTDDNDVITGLMPHGSALYVTKERHIYRVTYNRQPRIQPNVTCVAWRGCVNNRCKAIWQGQAYLLDCEGVWRLGLMGSGTDDVSGPIQNYFDDGTLDWTTAHRWYTSVDHEQGIIRWHVKLTSDSGSQSKTALAYNVGTGQWEIETYVSEMGGAACVPMSGRFRTLFASQDDQVYLTNEGLNDGVTSATTGTATSGGASTLVKTGAGWSSNAFRYASLGILAGTGKGQIRRIASNTSDTITVDTAWTTQPDSTSQFAVGAVPWRWKSGLFKIPSGDDGRQFEIPDLAGVRFTFTPTTNSASADARLYFNHDANPRDLVIGGKSIVGVTMTAGDPDYVRDLKLTRSDKGDAPGDAWIPVSGMKRPSENEGGAHFVAVELRGFQVSDRIVIHDVTLLGAAA